MYGLTAAIFFEILGHAASSLPWGLTIAALLVALVVIVLRGSFPRMEITPVGWLGLLAYGVLMLVFATITIGAIKLNITVTDLREAIETSAGVDIPSWLADKLSDYGSIDTVTADTLSGATGIINDISASLRSTAWKTGIWGAIISGVAFATGFRCASQTEKRRSARQTYRRASRSDDF